MRISLKTHIQDFSSVQNARYNKQALSVCSPTERPQITPALYLNLVQYFAV
jgi:hypothetical protein